MLSDLRFSETVYGLGAGIFFIGYFLFEIPSNIILHRVGARLWIARVMLSWGGDLGRDAVRDFGDRILHPALSAGCRGGRFFPRGDPVSDLLVSVRPTGRDHRAVHDRDSGRRGDRWADLRLDPEGDGRSARARGLAMALPARGAPLTRPRRGRAGVPR